MARGRGAGGSAGRVCGGESLVVASDEGDLVKRKDLVTGVLLIGVGLIFLASNLDMTPELNWGRMWPLILVVIGIGKIIAPDQEGRSGGLTLLLIAGIFLAHNYRVLSLHDSWPLFIVIAGLSVLFGAAQKKKEAK